MKQDLHECHGFITTGIANEAYLSYLAFLDVVIICKLKKYSRMMLLREFSDLLAEFFGKTKCKVLVLLSATFCALFLITPIVHRNTNPFHNSAMLLIIALKLLSYISALVHSLINALLFILKCPDCLSVDVGCKLSK